MREPSRAKSVSPTCQTSTVRKVNIILSWHTDHNDWFTRTRAIQSEYRTRIENIVRQVLCSVKPTSDPGACAAQREKALIKRCHSPVTRLCQLSGEISPPIQQIFPHSSPRWNK